MLWEGVLLGGKRPRRKFSDEFRQPHILPTVLNPIPRVSNAVSGSALRPTRRAVPRPANGPQPPRTAVRNGPTPPAAAAQHRQLADPTSALPDTTRPPRHDGPAHQGSGASGMLPDTPELRTSANRLPPPNEPRWCPDQRPTPPGRPSAPPPRFNTHNPASSGLIRMPLLVAVARRFSRRCIQPRLP